MTEDALNNVNSQSSLKTVALRVVELPLSLYSSLPQVRCSPGAKKLFAVAAFGAVSLIFLARHFKRRKGKTKKTPQPPWGQESFVPGFLTTAPSEKDSSRSSSRQNLSLSLNSKAGQSYNLYPNGALCSRFSGSAQSLASANSVNSSNSCACANNSSSWDKAAEDNEINAVNIPVTTPENLYLMAYWKYFYAAQGESLIRGVAWRLSYQMLELVTCLKPSRPCMGSWPSAVVHVPRGRNSLRSHVNEDVCTRMELFEEALRRWEQALTFRSRQAEDEADCGSIKLGAGDAIAEESVEDIMSAEFIHKLESVLQRAYRLQEEFEATLGSSDPSSLANDIEGSTVRRARPPVFCVCLPAGLSRENVEPNIATDSHSSLSLASAERGSCHAQRALQQGALEASRDRDRFPEQRLADSFSRGLAHRWGESTFKIACLPLIGHCFFCGFLDKNTDITVREDDDFCLRDTLSIASTDSFVSAAELSEHRELRGACALGSLCHYPLYEDALRLAEEGQVSCRVLRTEMLECLGDTDFLAKLHCVRQACEVILSERATRAFLAETGKKILSAIVVKARKNPKRFEEVFEEMMSFLEHTDHWENTELELAARGVKHLNFYDIVLDFILMDSFEDLENPPISIQNVVNNRWLNSSFKETAVASSCWSVLKQKRQHMKVPDGFIAHFYAVCEHISPVLAWGFLGPKSSLHDFCCFFKACKASALAVTRQGDSLALKAERRVYLFFLRYIVSRDVKRRRTDTCSVRTSVTRRYDAPFRAAAWDKRDAPSPRGQEGGAAPRQADRDRETVAKTLSDESTGHDQVLFFLKDIFDLEKVRYSGVDSLAEDVLQLLHRRSELLLAYLGADSLRRVNGCVAGSGSGPGRELAGGLLEARVQ
ncbi:MIGA1 protein, partial [Atractosteus spatula]|nr:MIGA1 protein [Atractosteus spatula]